MVPTPNPGTSKRCSFQSYAGSALNAVAAIAANDVWAVGAICGAGTAQTLTEHWDGTKWSAVRSPSESSSYATTLAGVAANSSTDVWAVGNYQLGLQYHWDTFAEHWDGTTWTVVDTPSVSTADKSYLNAAAAVSPTDVWAVGYSENTGNGTDLPLVEHYDGASWSIVPSPFSAKSSFNQLYAVSAVSASDIWAVGYQNENTQGQTGAGLVIHWDGTTWSLVDTPVAGAATLLYAVTAISTSDVWAVGYIQNTQGSNLVFLPVTEHWDGAQWSVVTPPDPGKAAQLYAVTNAGGNVWAVGAYSATGVKFGFMQNPLTVAVQR